VGAANGARAFHKQAALDATFSTLRATFVVGAAVVTHAVMAALGGFVAAAATILVVAYLVIGVGPTAPARFATATLARFFAGVAFYLLIVNTLMFVDGILLKRLLSETAAAAAADAQVGFYGAAQQVARIPYQLILAVTFVIFPLVSRATFDKDAARTRHYVAATMRYSLVVAALFASALGARPGAVLRLFYPTAEYGAGAAALGVLVGGYVCFSLFTIAGTIINGAGRTRPTTVIGLITLTVSAGATWTAISFALQHGGDALLAAAAATTGAMALGVVISGVYLRREFGAFLPPLSVARTALSVAAALAVGRLWPSTGLLGGKLGTLVSCAACALAYLVVAVASGELRPAELRRLRSS
jgi:stage V sporulation protein B